MKEKFVAWGCSRLLEFYVDWVGPEKILFAVDSSPTKQGTKFKGLEVKHPDNVAGNKVVIFAADNRSLQQILLALNQKGYVLGEDVALYSDLFYESFCDDFAKAFHVSPREEFYNASVAYTLSTAVPTYTTIIGNWMFLEMIALRDVEPIAEVGAFHGGNSLLALQFLATRQALLGRPAVPFYIIDSFEGFPEVGTEDDPAILPGQCAVETPFEFVESLFSSFKNVHLFKGRVPEVFDVMSANLYQLVFYDCDLYQPALDTFAYFWPRLIPGGVLMVHDYIGLEGVRKATNLFTGKLFPGSYDFHIFWQTTCAIIVKKG